MVGPKYFSNLALQSRASRDLIGIEETNQMNPCLGSRVMHICAVSKHQLSWSHVAILPYEIHSSIGWSLRPWHPNFHLDASRCCRLILQYTSVVITRNLRWHFQCYCFVVSLKLRHRWILYNRGPITGQDLGSTIFKYTVSNPVYQLFPLLLALRETHSLLCYIHMLQLQLPGPNFYSVYRRLLIHIQFQRSQKKQR